MNTAASFSHTIRNALFAVRDRFTARPRRTTWRASLADERRSSWHQHPHA